MLADYQRKHPIEFRFALGFLVCAGITVVLTALDFWFPDLWVIAGATAVCLGGGYLVKPVLLIFGRIKPLSLRGSGQYEGVPIYEIKSARANAFASGFANTKLTYFTSRATEILDDNELHAVLMHEMGHHKYNDALWGTVVALIIGNTIAVTVASLTNDISSALAFALGLSLPGLLVYLHYYRAKEKRADLYAADHLEHPEDLARALNKMLDEYRSKGVVYPKRHTFLTRYMITHPLVEERSAYLK